MNQERKEIIIKEIKYWKQTRLLPEQYCNYLLTLYSEGEEDPIIPNKARTNVSIRSMLNFFIVQILLLLTVVVIYFTDFPFLLQIVFGIICVLITAFLAKKTVSTLSQLGHFYFLIAAIILLVVVVEGVEQILPNNRLAMSIVIFANCILWLIIGLKFKMKYFMIGGSVGFLLITLFFLFY
ncbi:hypothetical protein BTR23_11670 [Alkalihalophilus pseudofirmus]|uniref:hypothetical protein n=1 Tax=Alkalihalobacterium alkalinitrilicum TaxID=427920 RepID=UPI00094DDFC4|nr:hypothetical protein [Alkalihalobacterium alkalinitrilicum]OLO38904.1 hypothetical protein BTR23_11670 [Alkalihalophilus pseudofirmus]